MEISPEVKSEKMSAIEPDQKMCIHEFGVRAFRIPAADDNTGEDFYGLCMRVVGHIATEDGSEKVASVDLTFDEDESRKLLLDVNEACKTLVSHKYSEEIGQDTDVLADTLANALLGMLGLTPDMLSGMEADGETVTVPDDKEV